MLKSKGKVKNIQPKKVILTLGATVLVFILLFSLYKIYLWQRDSVDTKKIMDGIQFSSDSVDFQALKSRNSDTVAWVSVPGTDINYPVVQAKNNDYYLNHSFDKKTNQAGWVFADYRNSFERLNQNTIIYGHGFLNKIMFGTLKNTINESWYSNEENYLIRLTTEKETTTWRVYSTYKIKTTDDYLDISFNNESELDNFINLTKSRSVHNFKETSDSVNKVLTLSTCYNRSERIVLHARLVNNYNLP